MRGSGALVMLRARCWLALPCSQEGQGSPWGWTVPSLLRASLGGVGALLGGVGRGLCPAEAQVGSYHRSPPSVPVCTEMGFAVIWVLLLSAAPHRTWGKTSPFPHPAGSGDSQQPCSPRCLHWAGGFPCPIGCSGCTAAPPYPMCPWIRPSSHHRGTEFSQPPLGGISPGPFAAGHTQICPCTGPGDRGWGGVPSAQGPCQVLCRQGDRQVQLQACRAPGYLRHGGSN